MKSFKGSSDLSKTGSDVQMSPQGQRPGQGRELQPAPSPRRERWSWWRPSSGRWDIGNCWCQRR